VFDRGFVTSWSFTLSLDCVGSSVSLGETVFYVTYHSFKRRISVLV
jgi:hypothetical protein